MSPSFRLCPFPGGLPAGRALTGSESRGKLPAQGLRFRPGAGPFPSSLPRRAREARPSIDPARTGTMTISRRIAAALGAGLALSFPVTAPAQSTPSGSGVSSGSGAGTGTGGSGLGSTGTGTSGGMSPSGTLRNTPSGPGAVPRTVPNQNSPNQNRQGGGAGTGGGPGGGGAGGGATGGAGAGAGAAGGGAGVDVPTPSRGTGRPLPGSALGPIESLRDPGAGPPIFGLELNGEQLKELDARL